MGVDVPVWGGFDAPRRPDENPPPVIGITSRGGRADADGAVVLVWVATGGWAGGTFAVIDVADCCDGTAAVFDAFLSVS